jgi:hypothetical protein
MIIAAEFTSAAAPPDWVGEAISWLETEINQQGNEALVAALKGAPLTDIAASQLGMAAFTHVLARLHQVKRGGA